MARLLLAARAAGNLRRTLAIASLVLGAALAFGHPAAAQTEERASKPFTICENQTYALCAAAKCTMFNDVAYCKCDVKKGDSISLTLASKKGGDACEVNASGAKNGYMVSTFSLPERVIAPRGDQAIYTCEAESSTGAYAQCDGGICFEGSIGQEYPGLGKLTRKQIICSCPAVVADPDTAKIGYQILGPYPCEQSFFKYCGSKTANMDNGSPLYVGAPTGSARFLTKKLDGSVPRLNHCARR